MRHILLASHSLISSWFSFIVLLTVGVLRPCVVWNPGRPLVCHLKRGVYWLELFGWDMHRRLLPKTCAQYTLLGYISYSTPDDAITDLLNTSNFIPQPRPHRWMCSQRNAQWSLLHTLVLSCETRLLRQWMLRLPSALFILGCIGIFFQQPRS